jgi:hypothetical protein
MRSHRAATDRPFRDDIAAAVGAYNQANLLATLPRNATRLLTVMFPTGDVCRLSLDAIAVQGFSRRHLPATLNRLARLGFLTWETDLGGARTTFHLHIPPRRPPPRKREIEAAIASHNSRTEQGALLLTPDAVRLLAVMFRRSSVCQRSIASLMQEGFDKRTLRKLLNSLTAAGFLSKEISQRGMVVSYHLHLPPRRQP